MSETWFALYTKHQHEKTAAALLERKGIQVFLPVYRTVHRWTDRNQSVVLPLFPCYLFVRTVLEAKLEILRTAGVRWLIENAGHACPIPDGEIEAVRKICSVEARFQPHPFLKQGDHVRIRDGALAGIQGILVRVKNQCRVVISVEPLQRSLSLEVDMANLESLGVASGGSR